MLERRASTTELGEQFVGSADVHATSALSRRLRPYHVESTGSRPITEVKQRRARLVLGWVTAWEYRVS